MAVHYHIPHFENHEISLHKRQINLFKIDYNISARPKRLAPPPLPDQNAGDTLQPLAIYIHGRIVASVFNMPRTQKSGIEREGERDTARETDRKTETDRQRPTDIQTETDRHIQTETDTDRHRYRHRDRHRQTQRQT